MLKLAPPVMPGAVVHISSAHRPDDVRIFQKECRTLAGAGYRVTYLVPGAREGEVDGVTFRAIRRPSGRLARLSLMGVAMLQAALAERAAVYHFHDPELLPVGIILKLLGRKVIYDVHEDVPSQVMAKHWVPKPLRALVAAAVKGLHYVAAQVFDGIVVAGEDVAAAFPSCAAVVVRNFPRIAEFDATTASELDGRGPVLVHLGGLGQTRASKELVEAIGAIAETHPVRLIIVGAFADDGSEAECRALPGWNSVEYLGWLPRREALRTLLRARVGVVLYKAGPNHDGLRSNRVFEYMAAGLPIVGPDLPAWRKLVSEDRCGVLCEPSDPVSIADAIRLLLTHPELAGEMGRKGRAAVETRYSWEAESRTLLNLYRDIVGPPASDAPPTSECH